MFVRPYRVRLFLGLTCGIIYAAANGLLVAAISPVCNLVFAGSTHFSLAEQLEHAPAFLRPTLERLARGLPHLELPHSSLGLILAISAIPAAMLLRNVFAYLNIYLVTWSAQRAVADLRTQLFNHLTNLPLSFFSQARTGELMSRITVDTQILSSAIGGWLASAVKDPVTIAFLLGWMLFQEPTLTLLAMVVLPACAVPIIIYNRKVRKSARAMQAHAAELSSLMHESFTGNRIIKAYNLEDMVLGQFRDTTRKYIGHNMRVIRANEIPSQLMEFLGAIGVALVLLYLGFASDKGKAQANPGHFTAFVVSIVLMYPPIKNLTRLQNQIHQARSANQRVFELLDTPSTVVDPVAPVPLQAQNADIEFRNVQFAYNDLPVLRDINLSVKAGQLVALVGRTGSGKTTLTNLLLRFYDPQQGSVSIGGTDIRQVAIKDLRRQIALVTQESILFNDTIRNNLALGRPGATEAEIRAAAAHAFAEEFILADPLGYEMVIGEKGARLSGGQRQRLTIARAILRNAPILVLDEATSSLDSEVERAVQEALEQLMQGRTTICIAHRLSTIQKADLIVVLDQGRIVETGTHTQLLQAQGPYRRLYELQFQPRA